MQRRGLILSLSLIAIIAAPLSVLLGSAITSRVLAGTGDIAPAAHHDIYNPTRTALVNAHRQLTESLAQEREILERIKRTREELDASLALLEKAEDLDPSMKTPIDSLRSQMAALQDTSSLCPLDSSSSLDLYSELLDGLQTLIDHY